MDMLRAEAAEGHRNTDAVSPDGCCVQIRRTVALWARAITMQFCRKGIRTGTCQQACGSPHLLTALAPCLAVYEVCSK